MDRSARRRREDCFHHYRSNLYVLLLFVIFWFIFFIFNDLRQTDYISKSTGSIFAKFSWFVELWRLRTVKSASDSLDTGEPIN